MELSKQEAKDIISRFLTKEWPLVDPEDLQVVKDSAGYCNTIHFVTRPAPTGCASSEPVAVVVRHSGGTQFESGMHAIKNTLLDETIIASYAANAGIGPKLIGLFPGGRVEELIPGGSLRATSATADQVAGTARALAHYHQMEPPLARDKLSRVRDARSYASAAKAKDKIVAHTKKNRPEFVDKVIAMLNWDLGTEWDWLLNTMEEGGCVKSFTNLDVNFANRLVKRDGSIAIIDYEFASYSYACADLGGHFVYRQIDVSNRKDLLSGLGYGTDEEKSAFLDAYLDELKKLGKESLLAKDKWMLHLDYGAMLCGLWVCDVILSTADPALMLAPELISFIYCYHANFMAVKERLTGGAK